MGSLRSSSNKTASASTTCTVTKPSGTTSGDILVAAVAKSTTASPSGVPSGWALVTSDTSIKTNVPFFNVIQNGCGFYWKEAGGSEPADYTWTSTSSEWAITILCFQDVVAPLRGPAGTIYSPALFDVNAVFVRTSTTIDFSARDPSWFSLQYDRYFYIVAPGISDTGQTRTLSALTGVANTVSNNSLVGISQIVGYDVVEFADVADSPVVPTVSCTVDSAAGTVRGFGLMMADYIARPDLKQARRINRRPPLSQVAL